MKVKNIDHHELQNAVQDTNQSLKFYAQSHEDLFSADPKNVTHGILSHFEEGKSAEIRVGVDPTDVYEATVAFERGATTKRGRKAIDAFSFKPGQSLTREAGGYSTDLITFDAGTGEALFPKGIGVNRQKLALAALRIIQDNFTVDATN